MTTIVFTEDFQALVDSTDDLEQLIFMKKDIESKRNDLWTPGHITSYLRNRYELNDAYTEMITRLDVKIDSKLASLGNDI